jgi:hypothetical protein
LIIESSLQSLADQVWYHLELPKESDDDMKNLMALMFPDRKVWLQSNGERDHDWYSATDRRTFYGINEGRCTYCLKWFPTRSNHYRYHMQSVHGIDAVTKAPFPKPSILRYDTKGVIFGWCLLCRNWVKLQSVVIEKREGITGIDMNRKCWHLHMMNVHGRWRRR